MSSAIRWELIHRALLCRILRSIAVSPGGDEAHPLTERPKTAKIKIKTAFTINFFIVHPLKICRPNQLLTPISMLL